MLKEGKKGLNSIASGTSHSNKSIESLDFFFQAEWFRCLVRDAPPVVWWHVGKPHHTDNPRRAARLPRARASSASKLKIRSAFAPPPPLPFHCSSAAQCPHPFLHLPF
jgi:hypothetical protein